MVKFSTFEPAIARPEDELLLVQDNVPKRLPVDAISTRVHIGQAPPEDGKQLWLQTNENELPIEPWFLHKSGNWLSQAAYSVKTYRSSVTGSTTRQEASPYLGAKLWIESFTAKCVLTTDFAAGDVTDFQLRLVNEAYQQSVVWYLRLENGVRNQAYQVAEDVGLVVDASDALAIWFRAQRTGTTRLRFVSMCTLLRKCYAST